MLGKNKCKILKEIRQKIADENDIPFVTKECSFQGECKGTCPRCESELRYLEKQLALRASLGKRVAVAALCAGMTMGISACGTSAQADNHTGDRSGSNTSVQPGTQTGSDQGGVVELSGEVEYIPEDDTDEDTSDASTQNTGTPSVESSDQAVSIDDYDLMGMVPPEEELP